jgi:hypothetical protein
MDPKHEENRCLAVEARNGGGRKMRSSRDTCNQANHPHLQPNAATIESLVPARSAARSWPAGRLPDQKSEAPDEKMLVFFYVRRGKLGFFTYHDFLTITSSSRIINRDILDYLARQGISF